MTHATNGETTTEHVPEQKVEHIGFQSADIVDPVFDETYTVHLRKRAGRWYGWIPLVPEVAGKGETKAELLKTLATKLREALEVREEAWDQQLEADIEAGKLDHLREEALKDIKAGRVIDL